MTAQELLIVNYETQRVAEMLTKAAELPLGEPRLRLLMAAFVTMGWIVRQPATGTIVTIAPP